MQELLSRFDSMLRVSSWGAPELAALRIAMIVVVATIAVIVVQRVIRAARVRIAAQVGDPDIARRIETLGRVFRYLAVVVISTLAIMMILAELGISLAPILGAAGVAGLAIGFGAQSLVKDYFNGFFILFEDQIRSGDMVRIATVAGLVEDVTLRHVRLRDTDGNVHFIPNGLITTVTNMSRSYARAVMDVGVAYRENVDEVFEVMRRVGAEMRIDAVLAPKILEDLEIAGVENWDDSAVTIRCRFKVAPLEQWNVRREFLRRLKKAFDAEGIEIPYPHLTVYAGVAKDGTAPALPLRVAGEALRDREPGAK